MAPATSAEGTADTGSIAVSANAEGKKSQSQMRHFYLVKGNTAISSGRLQSPRSRPTGSRIALKPSGDKARLMMSFNAVSWRTTNAKVAQERM